MASKWINKDLFNKFVNEKKNEKETNTTSSKRRSELAWRNPERGTVDKAKVYVGRFIPDPKGQFYKKYFYHMFRTGEQWSFFLCPKTHHFENYCPWCSVASKLYTGTKADKAMANEFKRKEKFVSNWFVIDDPRDAETSDESAKVNGKVRMYEFPGKVEVKLKEQVTDTKNGLGDLIFDPSDSGFDFVLKITSTKKDERGKEWPDYNLSEFSRKPHAIANSEKAIDAIMGDTIDLDEYIGSMERDDEDVISALKQHMVWELVESEWKKAKKIVDKVSEKVDEEDIPDFGSKKADEDELPFDVDSKEEEDLSDDQLLKELDSL
jgi:hypothetical protein